MPVRRPRPPRLTRARMGPGRIGAGARGLVQPAAAARPPAPAQAPQQQPAQFTPDADYLAGQARRQFERSQEETRLQTEQTQDTQDTQEAIRRLLGRGNDDRQGIRQGANQQGLFYSGQLTKRLDDYQADVTRQQGDLNLQAQRRADARAAARAALAAGATVDEAADRAAAVERQIGRDDVAANANALAPNPAPTVAYRPPAPRTAARPRRPRPRRRR